MLTEPTRRDLLSHATRLALLLTSVGVLPVLAQSQTQSKRLQHGGLRGPIDRRADEDAGRRLPVESKEVTITGPDIAENGAVVPVAVATALPGVNRMLILVEKNPAVMAAMFDVSEAVEATSRPA